MNDWIYEESWIRVDIFEIIESPKTFEELYQSLIKKWNMVYSKAKPIILRNLNYLIVYEWLATIKNDLIYRKGMEPPHKNKGRKSNQKAI